MRLINLMPLLIILVFLIGCTPAPQEQIVDVTKQPVITEQIVEPTTGTPEEPKHLPETLDEKVAEKETPKTVKELSKVEVKEYNGTRLDSIVDVRDVSIKGPQQVDKEAYRLLVLGLVEEPKTYTYDEVLDRQKYSKVVQLDCVMGWSAKVLWEGILLKDLLAEVKLKPEANTVIFHAADGYTTSLPLDYITEKDILLADKINNVTLNAERGWPFELVAEDKGGWKWIKWITKIELSADPEYEGYWEQRGYPVDGEV